MMHVAFSWNYRSSRVKYLICENYAGRKNRPKLTKEKKVEMLKIVFCSFAFHFKKCKFWRIGECVQRK